MHQVSSSPNDEDTGQSVLFREDQVVQGLFLQDRKEARSFRCTQDGRAERLGTGKLWAE